MMLPRGLSCADVLGEIHTPGGLLMDPSSPEGPGNDARLRAFGIIWHTLSLRFPAYLPCSFGYEDGIAWPVHPDDSKGVDFG
jgi:hypothetical protein